MLLRLPENGWNSSESKLVCFNGNKMESISLTTNFEELIANDECDKMISLTLDTDKKTMEGFQSLGLATNPAQNYFLINASDANELLQNTTQMVNLLKNKSLKKAKIELTYWIYPMAFIY